MIVKRLVWDEWNINHVARHGISPREVEEACLGDVVVNKTYAGRLRVIGKTLGDRWLAIILAPKQRLTYYPVTARPASRKERRRYEELKGGGQYDGEKKNNQ